MKHDITPQLALSAARVLRDYCDGIKADGFDKCVECIFGNGARDCILTQGYVPETWKIPDCDKCKGCFGASEDICQRCPKEG